MDKKDSFKSRYLIDGTLGEGASGKVYQCRDNVLAIDVAVKILHSSATAKALARFQKEAKITALLNHSNIIKVLDFGQTDDGNAYLVMELCPGQSLESMIKNNSIETLTEKLDILYGITEGLLHAQERGVLHRDIKPSNIIVTRDKNGKLLPKIADFGIAKVDEEELSLTKTGSLMGTPNYMSPEALNGTELDTRSDIYSFGCLAFELFTGKIPHASDTTIEMVKLRSEIEPPSLDSVSKAQFTAGIHQLVSTCLQSQREKRFQNFSAVKQQIEICQEELISTYNSEEPPKVTASKSKKISKVRMFVTLIVVFSILGAIAIVSMKYMKREQERQKKIQEAEKLKAKEKDEYMFDLLPAGAAQSSIVATTQPGSKLKWHKFYGVLESRDLANMEPHIKKLDRKLTALRCTHDTFKGTGLKNLKKYNLTGLTLEECWLNEESFKELGELDTLKELFLTGSKIIDDRSVSHLTGLKDLYLLDLASSEVTDSCLESLAKLPRLMEVNFHNCSKIEGDGIDRLKRLRILDLSATKFKNSNIKSLCRLRLLSALSLDGLSFSHQDLKPLLKAHLVTLNLKNNRIIDNYLAELSKMQSLKALNVVDNPSVSEKAITAFKKVRPDVKLISKEPKRKETLTIRDYMEKETNKELLKKLRFSEIRD